MAVLRACRGSACGGTIKEDSSLADLDNQIIDTTDDLPVPTSPIPIAQFGRIYIQPWRNVLFETSNVTLTAGADGSITSMGTQDSSAAASGFTAATAAANTQAQDVAARNTAVAAKNTAAASVAQYADTVNKSLADCLVQEAAIAKAGGHPVPCQ
ncbi:MAG: hypothetical protein WAM90_11365 [Rhodanobacter sp.]